MGSPARQLDPAAVKELLVHLEAAAAILRRILGEENSGAFKRDGLSYEQLRALARPPRRENR